MVSWDHSIQCPKRHLDRFSRLMRAHERDRQTDRLTDRQTDWPRYFACSDRLLSLAIAAMRPNNRTATISSHKSLLLIYRSLLLSKRLVYVRVRCVHDHLVCVEVSRTNSRIGDIFTGCLPDSFLYSYYGISLRHYCSVSCSNNGKCSNFNDNNKICLFHQ